MKLKKPMMLRHKLFFLILGSMLILLICIGSIFIVLINNMKDQRAESLAKYSDVMTASLAECNMTNFLNSTFQYAKLYAAINSISLYDFSPYETEEDFQSLCNLGLSIFNMTTTGETTAPSEDIYFILLGDWHYCNYPNGIEWTDVENMINEFYIRKAQDLVANTPDLDPSAVGPYGMEWVQSVPHGYTMYESNGDVYTFAFTNSADEGTNFYPFIAGVIYKYANALEPIEDVVKKAVAENNDDTEKQDAASFRQAIIYMSLTGVIMFLLCLLYTRILSKYIADPIETERLRAQQEKEALEETNRMKTTFLSDVSHELKTPLAAMSGYAQNAETDVAKGCETPVIQEKLKRITSEANRMALMVTQILDATRIEEGRMILEQTPCDLDELVRETAETYFAVLNKNANRLLLRIPVDLPKISGDRSRLERVFVNLISNAMKHTYNGTILVKAEQEEDHIRVTVKDTGNGISPEDLPHIWERYYKGKHSETGTGLGLYITKFIIESHGGTIDVESEVGKGTAFTFTLPRAVQDPALKSAV